MTMTLPAQVRVPAGVAFQQVGDEVVLLHLKTGVYWGLNPTGALIWEGIVQHGKVARILAHLRERYDAPEEQLVSTVGALLTQLSEEGLVVLDPAN
jgi:hypothetical protein